MIKTLIILAGGKSTRMGKIGDFVPKSLLPICDTSLLIKQINQAIEAKINNIYISTHPRFEEIIKKCTSYISGVEVFSNNSHDISSYSALASVIDNFQFKESILISLADIYFITNPFVFVTTIKENSSSLFVSKPYCISELEKGGIVFTEKDMATRIFAPSFPGNKKGFRWSGLVSLNIDDQNLLKSYSKEKKKEFPEEDFFSYLIGINRNVSVSETSDFINNNSAKEIIISSLYELLSRCSDKGKKQIQQTIKFLRK